MGLYQQQAGDVGVSLASSTIPSGSSIGAAADIAGGVFSSLAERNKADRSEIAKSEGAASAVDAQIMFNEIEMSTQQDMAKATTPAERDAAVAQGKVSKSLFRAQQLIEQKRLVTEKGYTALKAYQDILGKSGVELLSGFYADETKAQKEFDAEQDKKRVYLSTLSIDVSNKSTAEIDSLYASNMARMGKLQVAQTKVAQTEADVKNTLNEHHYEIGIQMSNSFELKMAELKRATSAEDKQRVLESIANMNFYNTVGQYGMKKEFYLKANQVSGDTLNQRFNTMKEGYMAAAKELLTKGALTQESSNRISRMRDENAVKTDQVMKKILTPEGYAIWQAADVKSPEQMRAIDDATKMFVRGRDLTVEGGVRTRAQQIQAASNLIKALDKAGIPVSNLNKSLIDDLASNITVSLESDVTERTEALNSLTPEMVNAASPAQLTAVKARVDRISDSVKSDFTNTIANQLDIDARSLGEVYQAAISKDGSKVVFVVSPKAVPEEGKRRTLTNSVFTNQLQALVRAKIAFGLSPEAAVKEVLEENVSEEKPDNLKEAEKRRNDLGSLSPEQMDFIKNLSKEDWQQLMQA